MIMSSKQMEFTIKYPLKDIKVTVAKLKSVSILSEHYCSSEDGIIHGYKKG